MLEQGLRFDGLAPNLQVKFPATRGRARGDRGGDRRGHLDQRHRLLHACPRRSPSARRSSGGWRRREAAGGDVGRMSPVCTLMIGRLDDWMKAVCERDDIAVDPAAPNWAGIAVFKRAAGDLPPSAASGRGCWRPPIATTSTGRS